MTSFGKQLKSLRAKQKITLREFARRLNKDAGNISKMERGLLPPPQDESIVRGYGDVLDIAQDSDEIRELITLAAVESGRIPQDVLNDQQLLDKLPIFFRTATGSQLEQQKVMTFLEGLKKA